MLELLIARGRRRFLVFGTAGALSNNIACGDLIVPISAVQDEGTSYHYLPPSRDVYASNSIVEDLKGILEEYNCRYVTGKIWTTDAFYRETLAKIKRRQLEGCLTVEMETSALFVVAKFRKVEIGLILYGADNVNRNKWDTRKLKHQINAHERLFWLCIETCLKDISS
jgi:uridine phosphorylase